MNTVYPIYLSQLTGSLAVVVGGGQVGERKVTGLLAVDARVRLVSPAATAALQELAKAGQIEWQIRPYCTGDLAGASLVFAATDQRSVNAEVAQAAKQSHILCNVADDPAEGDFHLPAVLRTDGLVVAVGTGGQHPARARRVRDQIAAWLASTKP